MTLISVLKHWVLQNKITIGRLFGMHNAIPTYCIASQKRLEMCLLVNARKIEMRLSIEEIFLDEYRNHISCVKIGINAVKELARAKRFRIGQNVDQKQMPF